MDKKAVTEIRKILSKERCRIDKVLGFIVDDQKELELVLSDSFHTMPEEELEKYMNISKKTLSGKISKTLYNIEFPNDEEKEGGKQAALYRILKDELNDKEKVKEYCEGLLSNTTIEGKYLFLLAYGAYDIPGKDSNGDTMDDTSDDVYQFVIGSLCPVKVTKSGLYYDEFEKKLVVRSSGFEIKNPDVGFLFPAFNDRLPDVHNILYYARTEDDRYPDFQEQLVGGVMPPSESLQKGLFAYLVEKSFGRDCDFANVNAVNTALNDLVLEDPEGALEKDRIRNLFAECGAGEDVLTRFDEAYDEGVTSVGTLKVGNVGGGNSVELKSATMKIQVQSEAAPLLTSKVINGQEYVLVPIQDGLTLNGIALKNARRDKAGGET